MKLSNFQILALVYGAFALVLAGVAMFLIIKCVELLSNFTALL